MCASFRKATEKALAIHEAHGGRKQDFKQELRDVYDWHTKVPGLCVEIMLLAWKWRSKSPLVYTSPAQSDDGDGSGIRVAMMPRTFWDGDPRFLETFDEHAREYLRLRFDASSLCSDKHYVCVFITKHQGLPNRFLRTTFTFDKQVVRGAEIIEALTSATRAEDLADAFSWVETSHLSAQETLQALRIRSTILDGSTMIPEGVPVSTRAFNNEVAYKIMRALCLEYHIRLTGLCGAAHLNDREGVIHGRDPSNHVRWRARLDDGKYVSVKAKNFVRIRRGDYQRRAP
jgi:hypothetical protein